MNHRLLFLAFCIALLPLLGCPQQYLYATVTAQVTSPPVYAQINFTTFTQPPASSGQSSQHLRLRFGNDGGDQLDLVFAPVDGRFPVGRYDITASGPSLSFTTYSNGQEVPLNLDIDEGFINLNVISIVDGLVQRAEGSFHLNFADPNNGSCTGNYVYAAPTSG